MGGWGRVPAGPPDTGPSPLSSPEWEISQPPLPRDELRKRQGALLQPIDVHRGRGPESELSQGVAWPRMSPSRLSLAHGRGSHACPARGLPLERHCPLCPASAFVSQGPLGPQPKCLVPSALHSLLLCLGPREGRMGSLQPALWISLQNGCGGLWGALLWGPWRDARPRVTADGE